jgi:hypothetical protein
MDRRKPGGFAVPSPCWGAEVPKNPLATRKGGLGRRGLRKHRDSPPFSARKKGALGFKAAGP